MNETAAFLLSTVMLAAFVLLGFGAKFARAPEHRRHGLLMMLMAAILMANVLIWVV